MSSRNAVLYHMLMAASSTLVHALAASVHVRNSCSMPMTSVERCPSIVPVCPASFCMKCVTRSCSAPYVCSLIAPTLSCVQLQNACDCESVAPHRWHAASAALSSVVSYVFFVLFLPCQCLSYSILRVSVMARRLCISVECICR